MAQFTLLINTDNDAFADDKAAEIARILRELSEKVAEDGPDRLIRLKDANGARVGFATGLDVSEVPA
jgi:hypothetical protein